MTHPLRLKCPECRTALLQGPQRPEAPLVGICPSCGRSEAEGLKTWQERRANWARERLATLLQEPAELVPTAKPPLRDPFDDELSEAMGNDGLEPWTRGRDSFIVWRDTGKLASRDEAERHLLLAAERGCAFAYAYLGQVALDRGDTVQAIGLFRKARIRGFPTTLDEPPRPTPEQLANLVRTVLTSAEDGNPSAQCEVAEWFFHGFDVARDIDKALDWLRRASERGSEAAGRKIAWLLECGGGRAPRSETVIDPQALLDFVTAGLGGDERLLSVEEGGVLPKNPLEAEGLLARASTSDDLDILVSQVNVDFLDRYVPLLSRAATSGNAQAQYLLSVWYRADTWGDEHIDPKSAVHWLRRAAARGYGPAEAEFALGVRADAEELAPEARNEVEWLIIHWLRRAALHEESEAQLELAHLLSASNQGEAAEAAYWYVRVASSPKPTPQRAAGAFFFASACEGGVGVSQDGARALNWYLRALEDAPSRRFVLGSWGGKWSLGAGTDPSDKARERVEALCRSGLGLAGDWLSTTESLFRAAAVGAPSALQLLRDLRARDACAGIYCELLELIGMHDVKRATRSWVAKARIDAMRRERGLRGPATPLHCVFSGPTGTGKTTVARILGRLLGALGILSRGHVREVDRAGLVGRYLGETAIKVDTVISEALGGVLFIDEAYSLSRAESPSDYGREAIDALVKRMEDHRTNLVVIAAGYEDEMKEFLESNPGLESRFPWHFRFDHYPPDQLLELFQQMVRKDGIRIDPGFSEALRQLLTRESKPERSFANGRYVRNIYEKACLRQGDRLYHHPNPSNEELQTLVRDDFPTE